MGIDITGLGLKEPVAVTTAHVLYHLGTFSGAGVGEPAEIRAERYTWQIITSGNYHIVLEGSIDGTNWFPLDEVTGSGSVMRHIVNKPIRFVRANVLSTSSDVEVSVWV